MLQVDGRVEVADSFVERNFFSSFLFCVIFSLKLRLNNAKCINTCALS